MQDEAIAITLRRLVRAPKGLSDRQVVRGARRLLILQIFGGGATIFMMWFSEMMRIMGGN